MAGLGTTETATFLLVPIKPNPSNQRHVTVLNHTIFGKKSVAGVATLKPPKEDGGFSCVWLEPSQPAVTGYCRGGNLTGFDWLGSRTLSCIIII